MIIMLIFIAITCCKTVSSLPVLLGSQIVISTTSVYNIPVAKIEKKFLNSSLSVRCCFTTVSHILVTFIQELSFIAKLEYLVA